MATTENYDKYENYGNKEETIATPKKVWQQRKITTTTKTTATTENCDHNEKSMATTKIWHSYLLPLNDIDPRFDVRKGIGNSEDGLSFVLVG